MNPGAHDHPSVRGGGDAQRTLGPGVNGRFLQAPEHRGDESRRNAQ